MQHDAPKREWHIQINRTYNIDKPELSTWPRQSANAAYGQRLKMIAVPIETKSGFQAGKPHLLFEGPYFQSFHDYAPTPDGRGFIMIRETQSQSAPTELAVV